MSRAKSKVPVVRVVGPLAPYGAEFTRELIERGYRPSTRVGHLRVMTHLSRWLRDRGLSVAELDGDRVEEYLAARRAGGYSSFRTRPRLTPLLGVLAAHGAPIGPTPPGPPAPVSRVDVLIGGYERFLRGERGLTVATTAMYALRARRFLVEHTVDADLSAVDPAAVSGAVFAEAQARSASAARLFATALRWLLRYAHVAGLIDTDLSTAALPVLGRPSSLLPRGVSSAQARALLGSCDRRTVAGRRDYAVLAILVRLGLRASEVAGLRLEDVDWRAGQITVRGKGHRVDAVPLPVDVGAAIAAWLHRGRPTTADRAVFVTVRAPRRALSRRAVSWIVHSACTRAGIPPVGAHALRHGLACDLLRAGAPLREIGELLRQHSDTTVSIYARVDIDRLRSIVLPWPGASSGSIR